MNAANEPALTGGAAGRRVVLLLLGLGLGVWGGCFLGLGLLKGALKHSPGRWRASEDFLSAASSLGL